MTSTLPCVAPYSSMTSLAVTPIRLDVGALAGDLELAEPQRNM